ncbi:MAG: iron-containing alcohol dehydrogenase [Planctomycetaceae bacterium]|jgi:alcohol dehydrogenase|nr:iron-containing alcohol dehydrogenase [Planctomycetaceae bacterium]MBT6153374.1 iron-containing alcohol dehydrogenase [Planctomycetaceae bacterium]MBT6485914.1 iron-containing alcohol dehydrogenase [Planctomycetaceae bacterium]MBT6494643.1 iron-containing alcohol dehydrogenase [Planctomycetaceae bacterium]
MRTTWTFHNAEQLLFGRGAVGQLGEIAESLGTRRLLVITDKTLVDAGLVDQVRAPLAAVDIAVEVFDGGEPEPPLHAVNDAIAMATESKPDLLLGLGGGSNMDIAKAVAVVMAHGGSVKDYAGDQIVPGPIFPLILMPTTAGTGSEVTAASVLCDTDAGGKFGILSNHLRPKFAIVDPMLTVSCPPKVTAASGIDALTHAVEAYTAIDNEDFPLPEGERTVYQGRHPLADVLAERAIELVGRHLRSAVEDGNDLEAREGMALAATLAGMAFSNVGVAVVHALEYALNQAAHTPHGTGCGLLLPFVMRFNASARLTQMSRIAELLGEDIAGLDAETAANRAVTAVERLKADIGIPTGMSEVGVTAEQVPEMAKAAFGVKRILRVNPRSVTQDDLESILQSALG